MGVQSNLVWFFRGAAVAAAALAATAAGAADYPTKKAPRAPAPAPAVAPITPGFFVKAGLLYAINQSSSKLYLNGSQLPGVGATISNIATLGFEAGYYLTPDLSIDISAGLPMWAEAKTTGTTLGAPPSGTLLSKFMPAFLPVTLLYHFNQFGAFQPYIGGGVAPVFALATHDEFDSGVTVDPTIGLVLQGGADVMIDQHWGWTFDVKKLFAEATSHATGLNVAPGVVIPAVGEQKTSFQPWILSTGVTYRF